MIRKATTAAVVLSIGAVMLVPSSAYAAGPNNVCYNAAGVNQTIGSELSVQDSFALNGVFLLTGMFIQNDDQTSSALWVSWRSAISATNKIIVGARNDSSTPNQATGWLVYTWKC
jgi:hypothetical protein